MSGGTPSTPDKSQRGDVKEPANARQQETESMRVHRRLQAKKAERCNTGTTSRDLAQARFSTKLHASALQRPPVSMATTTNLHLWPSTSSAYFLSLSRRGALATAPSTTAAFGQALPLAVTALRNVTSTANCAPCSRGKPDARTSTSRSSLAATVTIISLLDIAPANARQSSLRRHCTRTQTTRPWTCGTVPSQTVDETTALTASFCNVQSGAVIVPRSLCGRLVVTT